MANIQAINPASLFYWLLKVKVLIIFYTVSFTAAAAAVSVPYSNPGPVSQWQAPVQSSHENVGARVILPFLFKGLQTFSEIKSSGQNHSFIVSASESTGHSDPKIKEEETPYVVIEKISRLADKPDTSRFTMTGIMFHRERSPISKKPDDKQDINMQVDKPQGEAAESKAPDPDDGETPMEVEQSEQVSVQPVTMIKESLIESINKTLPQNHKASDLDKLKELKKNIEQESMTGAEITLRKEITDGLTQLHSEDLHIFERLPGLPDEEITESLILLHKAGFDIGGDITTLREALKFVRGLAMFLQKGEDSRPKAPDVYHVALMSAYILNYWYERSQEDRYLEDIDEYNTLFWITGLIFGRAPECSPNPGFQYAKSEAVTTEFHHRLCVCGLDYFKCIYMKLRANLFKEQALLPEENIKAMSENWEEYLRKNYPFDMLIQEAYGTFQSSFKFFMDHPSAQYNKKIKRSRGRGRK